MPKRLSQPEFVAIMAMLVATIAFSIDAMLPALPDIAAALSPDAPNRAQLVLTSFVLGMGVGTLFTGPLSDAYGRRPIILAGVLLYIAGAVAAALAHTLEHLLIARVVQGLGAAGPRVVAMAIIRDLYTGRQMAKLMSFVMLIFTLVPAFAPSLGAAIAVFAGWRGIFAAFVVFSLTSAIWLFRRQDETLPPGQRRPFRFGILARGIVEVLTNRQVVLSMVIQSLSFGILFSMLVSTQPVFDVVFGRAATFPLWFGGIALVAGSASLLNAAFVERLGMRYLVATALMAQVAISGVMCVLLVFGLLEGSLLFAGFVVWTTSVFFQAGLTIGNLNSLAMEPMGHLAGLTASIVGSVATVAAVLIAAPIGLAFDGTPRPLAIGIFCLAVLASLVMRALPDRHATEANAERAF